MKNVNLTSLLFLTIAVGAFVYALAVPSLPKKASEKTSEKASEKTSDETAAITASAETPSAPLTMEQMETPPIVAPDEITSSPNLIPDPSLITVEPEQKPAGMVWIPGGTFKMGSNHHPGSLGENPDKIKPDEYPSHIVDLDGYWIDPTLVTNAQFKAFVDATGYVTFAEQKPTRESFLDSFSAEEVAAIPEENLVPGSLCFNPDFDRKALVTDVPLWEYQVWKYVNGASWKHPFGPGTNIEQKMDHPVVHISYDDAIAYCNWAGKRLPTEAEFEYAARGGKPGIKYFWGNETTENGKYFANYWQGSFPLDRQNLDGFQDTNPVKSFPANGYGLYDMAGNVWEWCNDYYSATYYFESPRKNPQGPAESFDPTEPHIKFKHVTRGGSYLCNYNNCTGYRINARMRSDPKSPACHQGFRCVVSPGMWQTYSHAPQRTLVLK
jgi:formylglycine-generating enzyme required for sulfatase activity